MHKHSLVAKMCAIKVGETIYIDDPARDKDRGIQGLMIRSKDLQGMEFITARMVAVAMTPATAVPIVAIKRIA